MGWRFRKSFAPIPGVRVTLSKRGITTSVGVGPVRLSSGPAGAGLTATLPGTGLSYHQPLTGPSAPSPASPSPRLPAPAPVAYPVPTAPLSSTVMEEIRSGSSSVMTTPGLAAFKESLRNAEAQHAAIKVDLEQAQQLELQRVGKFNRWNDGWLFKRIWKKKFATLGELAEESTARRREFAEQLDLSLLNAQFEMSDEVAKAFDAMCEAFSACTRSQRIWDNVAQRQTNRVAERTTAGRVVDLKPVKFSLGKCSVIVAPMSVPQLENANGGDLYIYPGFLLYHAGSANYALVELDALDLQVSATQFQEEGPIPSDAQQVATTWAKANKDGTPDKRFKDNYAIPVMRYARLVVRSASGLNEEYMLSHVEAAEEFHRRLQSLKAAVRSG